MNKKLTIAILALSILISLFLHIYKLNEVPPCINADEAAFAYNAYSILKTGKDEYGKFMPLRFESFRDYKLPVYSYLSIPFIAVFGLNDFSTRALNIVLGIAFVPLIYLLTKELFENKKVALFASFLTSLSPGVYILSRHAHEGVESTFFVLTGLLFFIKYLKSRKLIYFVLSNFAILLNAFSYQTGRIYLVVFFFIYIFFLVKGEKNQKKFFFIKVGISILILLFSLFYDFKYGLNRVNNLFFFKNSGFRLTLTEYVAEHSTRLIHNKISEAIREITNRYFYQLSPQYLLVAGDTNWRFGFPNLGLFTPIEFLLFFIGLYYLFKNKEKFRFIVLFLFLITPLNNALTWQDPSLIRTYFMLFPIIIISSYGAVNLFKEYRAAKILFTISFITLVIFGFYKFNDWDLYFYHYPKRPITIRAWQCGYKELTEYVKKNYDRYDKFYITDRHGQPYIFFLYYWKYDPKSYQKQAKISGPDRYGFGQVAKFDKFEFHFVFDLKLKKSVFIGYPESFNDAPQEILDKVKKIKVGTEEIFWIYENN